ncbi:MAG: amidohydrolase family protein [Desulfovermiculus sp.]|nr:amidohydrolase family protein [Desulfovermiculus sp.]
MTILSSSHMQGFRCRRILTMDPHRPVLNNGLIWTGHGSILAIGPYSLGKDNFPAPIQDLGEQTMVPGLVNAHTHLELSHLRGLPTSGEGFLSWVQSLIKLPVHTLEPDMVHQAIEEMLANGVAGIGDISGQNPRRMHEIHTELPIPTRLFVEFLGFSSPPTVSWPVSTQPRESFLTAAGHALYSTHPDVLHKVKSWTAGYNRPFSIHLAEHEGELELLATGQGDFAEFLRGKLIPFSYRHPGLSPVAYADRLGLLDHKTLAVHCVHLSRRDIQTLRDQMVHVCLCPRSNAYIQCGRPPAEDLHKARVNLCLGTDGLSSNHDLNLWNEAGSLAHMWQGNLSLTELISFITINPARALSLEQTTGSLRPGKLARFSLVPRELEYALPL